MRARVHRGTRLIHEARGVFLSATDQGGTQAQAAHARPWQQPRDGGTFDAHDAGLVSAGRSSAVLLTRLQHAPTPRKSAWMMCGHAGEEGASPQVDLQRTRGIGKISVRGDFTEMIGGDKSGGMRAASNTRIAAEAKRR